MGPEVSEETSGGRAGVLEREIVLRAQGVTKRFGGVVAVDNVDLDVATGSVTGLIGPNGAGKTTLFNCITGFVRPDRGHIWIGGYEVVGLAPDQVTARGVARTYQNLRPFPNMSAVENVLVGLHLHLQSGLIHSVLQTRRQRQEERGALIRAIELLRFVGISASADTLATNLPYGDQRRLEIARALASRPCILLLDEPTAGMNPRESDDMVELITRLRDELELTILLIEHRMRVVMAVSERVTVLDQGRKIAEGRPEEIRRDRRVIEAYLGQANEAGGDE
jgi:branched-chain amino acid transport system ATP-binding protein